MEADPCVLGVPDFSQPVKSAEFGDEDLDIVTNIRFEDGGPAWRCPGSGLLKLAVGVSFR